jgi:hypothetical protein
MMFPTFPHNITFEESRELKINATPVDEDVETYTFIHNHQEYGVMVTEDATISAALQLVVLPPMVLIWQIHKELHRS